MVVQEVRLEVAFKYLVSFKGYIGSRYEFQVKNSA